MISNVNFETPNFDDHVLVMASLTIKNTKVPKTKIMRNWKNYTPHVAAAVLTCELNVLNNQFDDLNVQKQWNQLEQVMIESVDQVAPLVEQCLPRVGKPCQPTSIIKRKINKRKRLLQASRYMLNSTPYI